MKLLGSTKSEINKETNGENTPHLEVLLVHCNIAINDYQQNLRVLYTFFPNKSFNKILDISPKNFVFFETFRSEISNIEE